MADVGATTIIWDDNGVPGAVMVVERDLELVGESIDDTSTNAKTSKGAGARHEGDLGDVMPSLVMFGEFVVNELKKLLSEIAVKIMAISVVV